MDLKDVEHQTITSIFNLFTHENTIFNPLRGARPGANTGKDTQNYLTNLIATTKENCDFCNVITMTAEDTFTGTATFFITL